MIIGALLKAGVSGLGGGSAAADLSGKLGDRLFGKVWDQATKRLRAYGSTPGNHDLERALRFAQLTAALVIVEDERTLVSAERADERSAPPADPALDAARKFLWGQLGLSLQLTVRDNQSLVDELCAGLDVALAPQDQPGEAARLAMIATEGAWTELVQGMKPHAPPVALRAHFFGANDPTSGWHTAFMAYVREALTGNERARSTFLISRMATILRADGRIEALVNGLSAPIAAIKGDTEALLAGQADLGKTLAEMKRVLAELPKADGGEKATILRRVRAVLPEAVATKSDEHLPAALKIFIERAAAIERELAKRTNFSAEVEAARTRAGTHLEALRIAEAERELATARGLLRESREQTSREEATLLAEEAELAKLRLAYRDAASRLDQAADLMRFDHEAAWGYALRSANVVQSLGIEFGENSALREAADRYLRALALAPRDRVPLDWATTQNNRGAALRALGERGDTTALIDSAIAYRLALEERRRELVPLDWAATQNNLGNVLFTLGERGDDAALHAAISAYRLALEERRRDCVPLDWAITQTNLGNALRVLGERGDDAALSEAVAAYRLALGELRRECVPFEWATTQNNLGNALAALGSRGDDAALHHAVVAYRSALEEWRRDRRPLDWAMAQNNLVDRIRRKEPRHRAINGCLPPRQRDSSV